MESVSANIAGFGEMMNTDDVVSTADIEDISRRFLENQDSNSIHHQAQKFEDAMRDIDSRLGSQDQLRTPNDDGQYKYPKIHPPRTNEEMLWERRAPEVRRMGGFSLNTERDDDEKLELLEHIQMRRRNILLAQGEDALVGIPEVCESDSIETIRQVKRRLRVRGDSNAWTSIFEMMLRGMTQLIESTFNGEREVLGYTPNLKGWSEAANYQIRERRTDITDGVVGVMGTTQMGGFTSLTLHLTASAFSHAAGNAVGDQMSSKHRRDRKIAQEVDWSKKSKF